MNLWPEMVLPFIPYHRNHVLPYCREEPIIFPFLRQYHSTLSLLNNPDTDFYEDIPSNSPQHESETSFESFNPDTSIKTIAQHKANVHFPSAY